MAEAALIVSCGARLGLDPAGPELEPPGSGCTTGPDDLPPWLVSRTRAEAERARLLQLEREGLERQLIPAEVAAAAWAEVCQLSRARLLRVVAEAGAALPRLEPGDLAILRELLAEALGELVTPGPLAAAGWRPCP